jgi:hypothetical protein
VSGQMRKRGGKNGFRNRFVQQSPGRQTADAVETPQLADGARSFR